MTFLDAFSYQQKQKRKKNFAEIFFHNILTLFDVLTIILFTTRETCVIITDKHDIQRLPHELPIDLRLRILVNQELYQGTVQISENDSLVPSLFAKMKVLLILAENSLKVEIKLFPLSAISHGTRVSFSQLLSYCLCKLFWQ